MRYVSAHGALLVDGNASVPRLDLPQLQSVVKAVMIVGRDVSCSAQACLAKPIGSRSSLKLCCSLLYECNPAFMMAGNRVIVFSKGFPCL